MAVTKNLIAYVRVSSESQLDGFGLETQREACQKWAESAGFCIVSCSTDEAVAGKLKAEDRPGLAEALDALAAGTADGLVVARLDRFARSLAVQEATLAAIWKMGCRVYSATEGGEVHEDDPDDPIRTAMRQMRGVFAQLDRSQVVKRLRDGRKAKAATGRKAVGAYPYGYVAGGTGRDRDAVVDEDEQRVVSCVLQWRNGGASYREIARRLDADGIRPRRAASWSAMTVRNLVLRYADSQCQHVTGETLVSTATCQ